MELRFGWTCPDSSNQPHQLDSLRTDQYTLE
jgi:hypothetical protein